MLIGMADIGAKAVKRSKWVGHGREALRPLRRTKAHSRLKPLSGREAAQRPIAIAKSSMFGASLKQKFEPFAITLIF